MAKSNTSKNKANHAEMEHVKEITETLKQAKKDPAVKAAQKIEKQPVRPDDLSPLLNTKETGTSGGDQRASVNELKKARETGETLTEKKRNAPKKNLPDFH